MKKYIKSSKEITNQYLNELFRKIDWDDVDYADKLIDQTIKKELGVSQIFDQAKYINMLDDKVKDELMNLLEDPEAIHNHKLKSKKKSQKMTEEEIEELYEDFDYIYNDRFMNTEMKVIDEMGLYIDFSSIRYDAGPIWIFSDPNHENMSDMWEGDVDEDALAKLDFSEYTEGLIQNVLCYPQEQWARRYKKYLKSLIKG